MAGTTNPCAQIDFGSLVNITYAIILIQAIKDSIRAAKIAELRDKKVKLQANIEFYQGRLKDISAAEKRIAEGITPETTQINLSKSQKNLSLLAARKEELNTKLNKAERNLKNADKCIEKLLAKSSLIADREAQKFHYIFFPQTGMQKDNMLTLKYTGAFSKGP